MTMQHLPVELYTQIFEHLQLTTHDARKTDAQAKRKDDFARLNTLRSICLASKSFHQIAWPILYRVYPFTPTSLEFESHATTDGETRDELYLRTLHQNSAYADALWFLYIDVSRPESKKICFPSTRPSQDSPYQVDRSCYISQPGSHPKRSRITGQQRGLYEYFVALVVLMCRNVQGVHLNTADCDCPETSLLDEAFSLASIEFPDLYAPQSDLGPGQREVYRNLKTTTVVFERKSYNSSFQCEAHSWLSRAMQSTSLEILTLRNIFWQSIPEEFWDPEDEEFLPRPLIEIKHMHLKTLQLLEYGAGGFLVAELVKCCPSLSVLEVVWTDVSHSNDYYNSAWAYIAFDLIAAAIASHAPNLSKLVLDDSEQVATRNWPQSQHTFGKALHDMRFLRTISASEFAFYGGVHAEQDEAHITEAHITEALPRCLESLRIIGPKYQQGSLDSLGENRASEVKHHDDLRLLLQDTTFTSLQRVVVDYHSSVGDGVYPWSCKDREPSWGREPKRFYNDDLASNEWKLGEDVGNAAETLVRSIHHTADVSVPEEGNSTVTAK